MLILTRTTRIDWPRMAHNLRRLGLTAQQIADQLEVSRSSLDNWMADDASGEPAFWTGAKLIELWCVRTGLQWTEIPLRKVAPSVSAVLRSSR